MDEQYSDGRLDSGGGARPVSENIDFINMSGLTRPFSTSPTADPVEQEEESLDPDSLVSFFEPGVEDVDSAMDSANTSLLDDEMLDAEDDESESTVSESASLTGLDEIISDLSRPETPEVSEPNMDNLSASLDAELEKEPAPAPEPPKVETVPETAAQDFEKAESLLNELENQPKEKPIVREEKVSLDSPRAEITPSDFNNGDEQDASVYQKPRISSGQPRHQGRRSAGRGIRLAIFAFVFLLATVGAFYYSVSTLMNQTMTPGESYAKGEELLSSGEFAAAAAHFDHFASRYASDPLSADAEFMSAYALYLTPPEPQHVAMNAYQSARERMEIFVMNYPSHTKAARGETLLAMLEFRLGNYDRTVEILEDPQRRLRDPEAFLPSLRTLARAHSKQGNLQMAEAEFMRAASLTENISPDEDYMELANIYNDLGLHESHPALAASYFEKAVANWDRVMRLPGTLSTKRRDLEVLSDYTKHRIRDLMANREIPQSIDTDPTVVDPDTLRLPERVPGTGESE